MVEDFKLPAGRLYVKNGKVFQYAIRMIFNYMGYPEEKAISEEIDLEKLKLWLEEATRTRYRIIHAMNFGDEHYEIIDDDKRAISGHGGVIARFFVKQDSYNAKAEAEKLCKELNEKER